MYMNMHCGQMNKKQNTNIPIKFVNNKLYRTHVRVYLIYMFLCTSLFSQKTHHFVVFFFQIQLFTLFSKFFLIFPNEIFKYFDIYMYMYIE